MRAFSQSNGWDADSDGVLSGESVSRMIRVLGVTGKEARMGVVGDGTVDALDGPALLGEANGAAWAACPWEMRRRDIVLGSSRGTAGA